jgi:hypothetical protein
MFVGIFSEYNHSDQIVKRVRSLVVTRTSVAPQVLDSTPRERIF